MRFLNGAPIFAAEVRSDGDYDAAAVVAMERKRADYFAAGTLVVWDVDLLSEEVVRKFTSAVGASRSANVCLRGKEADAEPAVRGWKLMVNDLFDDD